MFKKEIQLIALALFCLFLFCGMGTICKNIWPLWNTKSQEGFYHWDKAFALRDFFLSFTFGFLSVLAFFLSKPYKFLPSALILISGIFFTDAVDKLYHYFYLWYDVSNITKDDVIGMGFISLLVYYNHLKNNSGNFKKTT